MDIEISMQQESQQVSMFNTWESEADNNQQD